MKYFTHLNDRFALEGHMVEQVLGSKLKHLKIPILQRNNSGCLGEFVGIQ